MTAATVRVPQPLIAVGVVVSDAVARILTVRLSENEKGYGRLLYRQAFQAWWWRRRLGGRTGLCGLVRRVVIGSRSLSLVTIKRCCSTFQPASRFISRWSPNRG